MSRSLCHAACCAVQGRYNSIYFDGAYETKPLRLTTAPNSLATFKAANKLVNTPYSNTLTVTVPQNGTAWRRGDRRTFYFYHQLAFANQQYYLTVPNVSWQALRTAGRGHRAACKTRAWGLQPPCSDRPEKTAVPATPTRAAVLIRWCRWCLSPSALQVGAKCTAGGYLSVASLTDFSSANKYEVAMTALACKDIPKKAVLQLRVTVGALSS